MADNVLNMSLKSDLYAAKNSIATLMNFINRSLPQLSSEDKFDIKLIYSELLFNAIIHGNKNDMNKRVRLSVKINEDGTIVSSIVDEGKGFDYNHIFHKLHKSDNLSDNGRGIQLVQALCDTLNFNDSGNEIHFSKRMAIRNVQAHNR